MNENKSELYMKYKDYTVKMIIVVSFFLINLYLVSFHEIWRDEAQAWLLARDCSIPQLFSMMKSEGHPCLWHLILMPFAKLNFNISIMNVISCVITSVGVGIITFKAPFGYFYKILIAVLCTYFIPVISRSYCLAVPLLALLGCYYPVRKKKVIQYSVVLFFLSQIHLIFQGLVIALVLIALMDAIAEKKKTIYSFLPFISGMLGLAVFILQLAGCKSNLLSSLLRDGVRIPIVVFKNSEFIFLLLSQGTIGKVITVPMMGLMILLFITLLLSVKKYYRELIIFSFTFGAQLVINSYVFLSSIHRSICTVLCLVLFSWIMAEKGKNDDNPRFVNVLADSLPKYIVIILCAGFIFGLVDKVGDDIAKPYSNSETVAEKIRDLNENNVVIITSDDAVAASVNAYLKGSCTFYSLSQRKAFSYVDWRDNMEIPAGIDYIYSVINDDLSQYEHVYYLSLADNIPDGMIEDNSSVLFLSDYYTCTDEILFLYRIR